MIIVAKDGSGDYTTIQQAVDAAPEGALILVREGIYDEKLVIHKPNLRIVGASRENTVLTHSYYAKMHFDDGTEQGTFCTYTLLVCADGVTVENMTIRNDAGPGKIVGQAVAVYAAADRDVFRSCNMIANQDTLFCGPASEKTARVSSPYDIGKTDSPGDCNDLGRRVYFEDCFIRGDIDFIFGSYRCWFERCTLFCNDRGAKVNGYYTAANTPLNQPYGFIFHACELTGDAGEGTVYLGRPWRSGAHTLFISCRMDACVHPAGWQDWDADRPVTRRLCEYGTTGAGADMSARHPKCGVLTDEEAKAVTVETVLGGRDGWDPAEPKPSIYIAGDSTAYDYEPDRYPRTGWGTMLPKFLDGEVPVYNEAASGRSTKSYIDERRLENIACCLRRGDVLMVQFGHNDEKTEDPSRGTYPESTFPENLRIFIDTARRTGAYPVLLTSIARRHFDENGKLMMTHGDYPDAMRKVADEEGIPLLDTESRTFELVSELGEVKSKAFYNHLPKGHPNYPDGSADDTHLSADGAEAVAKIVAELMLEKKAPLWEHVKL